jgi:putative ABC transport system ATP-binding protein
MIAVMGPSGSGKSTLMNIVGCLDVPSEGQYLIDDQDVSRLNDDQLAEIRCRKIGFVFQSFNLLARTTALANVELPLVYAGVSGRERRQRAVESLTLVGLGDRLHHKPSELSGGQQQRVAVARALASRPAVIFADEPTGNLDSRTGAEILDFMRVAVKEFGQTIVMVTHDPNASAYSDRVVFLADGKIVDEMAAPSAGRVFERMAHLGD